MKRWMIGFAAASVILSAAPVFAQSAAPATVAGVTITPLELPATAVVAASGTGVATAIGTAVPGEDLPGAELVLKDGLSLAVAAYHFFKDGNWAMGFAALWFVLLIAFRRVYMPWLKGAMSKTVRNITISVVSFGSIMFSGILSGLAILPAVIGGVTLSGIITLVWNMIGDLKFMKKVSGKDKEKG